MHFLIKNQNDTTNLLSLFPLLRFDSISRSDREYNIVSSSVAVCAVCGVCGVCRVYIHPSAHRTACLHQICPYWINYIYLDTLTQFDESISLIKLSITVLY